VRIYGVNPVVEALRAGRAKSVRVNARGGERVREVERLARQCGVPVVDVEARDLDRETAGGAHQGVAADVRGLPEYDVGGLLRAATGTPLFLVLDGIEDPHNVGAILRTADAAGVHGVIRQTRRAAPLEGAAAKASAGAVAHVKVASVVNVARALEELKKAGVWTIGLAAEAPVRYDQADLGLPTALVVGAEGAGLRRLVRERCDRLVSIPMRGRVESLNVSVAAAIVLFEAVRQRQQQSSG
jgi:23S rRNA (guanosine2251-2'-O)-methyltransferase